MTFANANFDSILELTNVSLSDNWGEKFLLQNISLSFTNQERVGIVGASGAGKSTLLKLCNNLQSPSQGELSFCQQPLTNFPAQELRQKMMLVPQEPKLLGMNVQTTLAYPLTLQKLPSHTIKERLNWCLETFSLPESWLSRQASELSVGQRQLVAIARGMIVKPKVLLLDEPTSALDRGKARFLQKLLIKICEQESIAIVVVNHDLKWMQDFAQRIIWLDQGQVKQDSRRQAIDWQVVEEELLKNSINDDFEDF